MTRVGTVIGPFLRKFPQRNRSAYRASMVTEGKAGSPWLFTDSIGGFLNKSNFAAKVWLPLRKAAGLPKTLRFHDLRHAHASTLLRLNVHPKIVQERLGHSNISLTLGVYSHLIPDAQDEAADAIDRAWNSANSANGCQTRLGRVWGCCENRMILAGFSQIARPGFEPEPSDPESLVLPLHHRAVERVFKLKPSQTRFSPEYNEVGLAAKSARSFFRMLWARVHTGRV